MLDPGAAAAERQRKAVERKQELKPVSFLISMSTQSVHQPCAGDVGSRGGGGRAAAQGGAQGRRAEAEAGRRAPPPRRRPAGQEPAEEGPPRRRVGRVQYPPCDESRLQQESRCVEVSTASAQLETCRKCKSEVGLCGRRAGLPFKKGKGEKGSCRKCRHVLACRSRNAVGRAVVVQSDCTESGKQVCVPAECSGTGAALQHRAVVVAANKWKLQSVSFPWVQSSMTMHERHSWCIMQWRRGDNLDV